MCCEGPLLAPRCDKILIPAITSVCHVKFWILKFENSKIFWVSRIYVAMRCSLMPCNAMKPHPRMQRRPRKLTKLNIFNFEIWVLFDFNDSRIIFYIHIVKTGATFIIRAVRTVWRIRAIRTAMIVNCVMSLDYICYTFYMHSTYI